MHCNIQLHKEPPILAHCRSCAHQATMAEPRGAMPAAWAAFVDGSLWRLREAQLLRTLRPLLPSLDAMQVCSGFAAMSAALQAPAAVNGNAFRLLTADPDDLKPASACRRQRRCFSPAHR